MKNIITLVVEKFFILIFVLSSGILFGQIVNKDKIYDPNIQTVLLHEAGVQLTDPIIVLGTGKKLQLEFDDMSDDAYIFRYTIIHCTSDWETSDLEQIEYIDGYFEDDITEYNFSLNAVPQYIHYNLIFPSPNMKLKISGNYIVKVYVDSPEDENVIITRRFFVIEPLVRIKALFPYYPKMLEYTRLKQQIDLKLYTPDLFTAEPMQRMNVTIRQNGRWDNIKSGLKPTSILMNELDYNYRDGIVFDGGNEFRNFDMKSYWYQSPQIRKIISDENGYEVILHTDGPRKDKPYESLEDINGVCYIKARPNQETAIEGEYAWVEFTLNHKKIQNADVYILGQLNDWHLDGRSKMNYNEQINGYNGEMFLKQGYYNYNYVVVPKGEKQGDITIIEGDYWDTFNDYTIYVYYTERIPEYDRLVGYLKLSSH